MNEENNERERREWQDYNQLTVACEKHERIRVTLKGAQLRDASTGCKTDICIGFGCGTSPDARVWRFLMILLGVH